MVQQARIGFSGTIRAGSETVLHFADGADPNDIAGWLDDLIEVMDGAMTIGAKATRDPLIRQLVTATGELTGEVATAGSVAVNGTSSPPQLADQSNMLLRWRTPLVVGGRRLIGRSFWPGIAASYSSGGQPSAGDVFPIVPILQNWVDSTSGAFVLWSRVHGVVAPVTSAGIAPFWASQRRRRDT